MYEVRAMDNLVDRCDERMRSKAEVSVNESKPC